MLQNAPFKIIFSGKHAPDPPSKRLATPRVTATLQHATRPAPQKVGHPLANPAYAHGLLLRNLLEEMHW